MGLLSGSTSAYKSVDRTNFTATNGQTTFTVTQGYNVGDVDVYLNGVKLFEGDDYYATNGTTVVVNSACSAGDVIQVVSYNQFLSANSYTKSESDGRYMVATGATPMTSYLRTPNYGVSSYSDSASASLEASSGSGEQGVGIKAFGRSVATFGGDILYTADNRGAGGRHRFGYWNGTSFTETMKLDSSGRMNLINQPSIQLDGNSSSVTFTAGQYITQLSSIHNNGGMVWDNSLGRVTVPVSGRYLISSNVYHYSIGGRRHTIIHNGSSIALSHSANSTTADESRTCTIVRNMAAGDWLGIRIEYAGVYYIGSAHTYFSVHLLG